MLNSDDTNKNKFPFYFNNDNKNKYSQNKPYQVNNKKYDNIENNYIKGFNSNNNKININKYINNEIPKTSSKNKYDFNLNLSESSPNFNNNFIKKNYNNYSKNNHQTQKDIQDLLNPLKNNQKIASLFHINMKQIYSTIDQ